MLRGILWTALSLSEMGRAAMPFWIRECCAQVTQVVGARSRAPVEQLPEGRRAPRTRGGLALEKVGRVRDGSFS